MRTRPKKKLVVDKSDWDIKNPESVETCPKCGMPSKDGIRSKTTHTGWYLCLCNWDFSKVKRL